MTPKKDPKCPYLKSLKRRLSELHTFTHKVQLCRALSCDSVWTVDWSLRSGLSALSSESLRSDLSREVGPEFSKDPGATWSPGVSSSSLHSISFTDSPLARRHQLQSPYSGSFEALRPCYSPEALRPCYSPEALRPCYSPEALRPCYSPEALRPCYSPEALRPCYSISRFLLDPLG